MSRDSRSRRTSSHVPITFEQLESRCLLSSAGRTTQSIHAAQLAQPDEDSLVGEHERRSTLRARQNAETDFGVRQNNGDEDEDSDNDNDSDDEDETGDDDTTDDADDSGDSDNDSDDDDENGDDDDDSDSDDDSDNDDDGGSDSDDDEGSDDDDNGTDDTDDDDDDDDSGGSSAAVTVENVTEVEGTGLVFTVTLSAAVPGGTSVNVTLTDVTATGGPAPLVAPEDYDNVVATLNFTGTAGETRQFTVATLNDSVLESAETFTVSLNAADPSVTDTDTATGTITDNDSAAVTVENVSATEGAGLLFTVTLSAAVQGGTTVNVTLTDVTATGGAAPLVAPEDYDNVVAALNFTGTAGETRQFTVATLNDTAVESDETFTVSLNASNSAVTDTDTATGTINDNDTAVATAFAAASTAALESEGSVAQHSTARTDAVLHHFIVGLNTPAGTASLVARQLARQYGLDVDTIYDAALQGFAATVPAHSLGRLASDPRVRYVEPDRHVAGGVFSSGLDRVNGSQAASVIPTDAITGVAPGLNGINVAILDTGIDLNNPDLNVLGGVSFVSGNASGQDDHGHGTGVASLVGARADRSGVSSANQGITGVAPGIGLYAVKVLDKYGSGTISSIISGINWVAQNAAANSILFANMSLGGMGYSIAMHDAIARATAAGVTFLVAAGNDGINAAYTNPAGFDDTVITVSALADSDGQPGGLGRATRYGPDDALASFSNYGSVIDVVAPGVNITMDRLGGGTWVASGTSMATPIATGVAALVVAADRRLGLTSGFDAQAPSQRWQYIRSRLIATGTAPDATVTTDTGRQVLNGGQPGNMYVPVVTYVMVHRRRRTLIVPQVTYYAVSSAGQWRNDPDGVAEPLVNAHNAYATG